MTKKGSLRSVRSAAGADPGSIITAIIATHMPAMSCGSVFVMASYPEGAFAVLVAALRREVEILVVDAERVDAACEGRVRAEDLALFPQEHAHPLTLGGERILLDEVVERFLLLHLFGREG